jgi:hypothetical protein
MSVFCKQKRYKLRMDCLIGSEISSEETAYQLPIYGSVISWEMYVLETSEDALEVFSKFLYLGGLACAVQTLKYYQHMIIFLVIIQS